jgi:DNA-binding IclR family transcriptional regulator
MVIAGVQNISTPITDYSGAVVAALTVPFIQRLNSSDDPDTDTVKRAIVDVGREISTQLGSNAAN